MAGSSSKKEAKSQVSGTSRVSSAAGAVGSQSVQKAQMEQRTNLPSSRQGQTPRTRASASSSPSRSGRGASVSGARKKGAASSRPGASPRSAAPPPATSDTRFLQWAQQKWASLEAHQRQRVFSSVLLVLSLLLFGSLTFFSKVPVLRNINQFFLVFFGWSAYPLSIGLVLFAAAHLMEGLRNERLVRLSMVWGLVVIWLLLLVESRLLLGYGKAGVLADLLALPLLGWPTAVAHVGLIGLLILAIILTFRITFGHVLLVVGFFQRLVADPLPRAGESDEMELSERRRISAFLGQRPRFSRFGRSAGIKIGPQDDEEEEEEIDETPTIPNDREAVQQIVMAAKRRSAPPQQYEDEEDDENVEFEQDFGFDDEDDDPRNDINIHKHHVGSVPRRDLKVPPALDARGYANSVRGANQQELPFNESQARRAGAKRGEEIANSRMEPLAPNPRLGKRQEQQAINLPGAEAVPKIPKGAKNVPSQVMPNVISRWKLPENTLLNNAEETKLQAYGDDTAELARLIQETLHSFHVNAEVRPEDISIGPTVIRFGIRPTGKASMIKDDKTGRMIPALDAAGNIVYETRTRVSRIMALQNDLALVLEAKTIRMEAPVPGRPYVGVEVPNKNSRMVTLREVLESKEYLAAKGKSKLSIGLGKDVAGQVRLGDLARMPHLLIAGATGAGKSVCINTIIASILTQATPDDVRMLMVDPKMVELSLYNGIPHLLSPVVIDVDKVVPLLKNAINEMERRYRLFSQLGVRNLDGYRKMRRERIANGDTSLNNLPAIVIIIDELADLMMAAPEEVESMICRLAQLARATGIHLVIATQRPSVDVITGLIKANIPTRISFMVSSAVDSRTIIDMGGAERLLGRGDMLYLPADAGRPERIQGAFLADEEVERLVEYWSKQAQAIANEGAEDPVAAPAHQVVEPGWEIKDEPNSDDVELDDELLDRAEEIVREYGRASISLLQRRLRIGYSRAARLIDLLEDRGIIGQFEPGGRAREILDSSNGGGSHHHADESGDSLADVAEDIAAEERARNDFLRQQAAKRNIAAGRQEE
ncbi:hypothetical protein KSC_078170 [Ktedonobacter sp. SOSP1-52]|uniref:DNA translocase FtsK n=1 Tax=Ktedonobacter sp. SOSP1-52 TaxID=2778366 RepID=UPI00191665E9|nr:DNA translocase FtsK [Ktedonobacter sp. SOSP1-52]GHO68925.1 hypothetical protein KSC_078170 [Ktedonobacter sp. SOSP1-52]